VKLRQDQAVC